MRLSEYLRTLGVPVGTVEDFPRGSIERAKLQSVRLHSEWSLATTTADSWRHEAERVKNEGAHRLLGFKTFDAYLKAVIGEDEKGAAKRFEARATKQGERSDIGTVPMSDRQVDRAAANGISNRTQRYLDHLAADRPDLLEKVNNGELKPKTAARQAGIVKEPTPLEKILKLLPKLNARDRAKLLKHLEKKP